MADRGPDTRCRAHAYTRRSCRGATRPGPSRRRGRARRVERAARHPGIRFRRGCAATELVLDPRPAERLDVGGEGVQVRLVGHVSQDRRGGHRRPGGDRRRGHRRSRDSGRGGARCRRTRPADREQERVAHRQRGQRNDVDPPSVHPSEPATVDALIRIEPDLSDVYARSRGGASLTMTRPEAAALRSICRGVSLR